MSLTQMQVFNEYIMPATIETLDQMLVAFNAASRGAIILSPDGFTGDFLQESFFQTLAAAQRRVDRYAANGTAPITDLEELKNSSVKIAGGFGPVRYEPSQMTWLVAIAVALVASTADAGGTTVRNAQVALLL